MKKWETPEIVDLKIALTAGMVGFGGIKNDSPSYHGDTPSYHTATPSVTTTPFVVVSAIPGNADSDE